MKTVVLLAGVALSLPMAPIASAAVLEAKSPKLVAFDGVQPLAREANRQRLLSQVLQFTIEVDASGKPTSCEISKNFRRKYVEIAMCRPMLKYLTFEPARDSEGTAVAGTYVQTVDFRTWMSEKGDLKQY